MSSTRGLPSVRGEARALLAVAAGGALGATARYAVDVGAAAWDLAAPWATLTVNLVGCALMGVLVSAILAHPSRHPLWRPFLGIGVLGGFTTFSSFSLDVAVLWERGMAPAAFAYVLASVIGSICALFAGLWLVRMMG